MGLAPKRKNTKVPSKRWGELRRKSQSAVWRLRYDWASKVWFWQMDVHGGVPSHRLIAINGYDSKAANLSAIIDSNLAVYIRIAQELLLPVFNNRCRKKSGWLITKALHLRVLMLPRPSFPGFTMKKLIDRNNHLDCHEFNKIVSGSQMCAIW